MTITVKQTVKHVLQTGQTRLTSNAHQLGQAVTLCSSASRGQAADVKALLCAGYAVDGKNIQVGFSCNRVACDAVELAVGHKLSDLSYHLEKWVKGNSSLLPGPIPTCYINTT